MRAIQTATDNYITTFLPLLDLFDGYLNSSSFTEKLAIIDKVLGIYNATKEVIAIYSIQVGTFLVISLSLISISIEWFLYPCFTP